jgi:hypothetical protein
MARKITPIKTPAKVAPKPVAKAIASSPVRNSPIPKVAARPATAPKSITQEMIAIRAFEISCGPNCGSEHDNWYRAERELRG